MPIRRTVFFVSDRTGITAEMLGNSLLSQFEEIEFSRITIPFVDSPDKVTSVIKQINETAEREGRPAIVFSSIVDDAVSDSVRRNTNALSLDFFQVFIGPLEVRNWSCGVIMGIFCQATVGWISPRSIRNRTFAALRPVAGGSWGCVSWPIRTLASFTIL